MSFDLKKALAVAEEASSSAASFLKRFQQDVVIEKHKDNVDIQTNADLQAEKIAIDTIQKSFPNHNIHSEEAGLIDNKSEYTWVIDPLDGTINYCNRSPIYATAISLENKDRLLVAALNFPAMDCFYSAGIKSKSYLNQKSISVNSTSRLDHSLVLSRLPYKSLGLKTVNSVFKTLNKLAQRSYKLIGGNYSNLNLCLIGQGYASAYVNLLPQRQWHDFAPGILIAQQGGAKITDRYGQAIKLGNLNNGIVVSNGLIHDQLLNILNQPSGSDPEGLVI